ncbi:MAG: biopolymer transporter ExbD [Bacteroidota bacterium]
MPRIKKKRPEVNMDMMPFVNMSFLLLTFFMLSTKFKAPEDFQLNLPSSHAKAKVPESDVMTVTIAPDGKILFGVDSQQLRSQLFGDQNKLKISMPITLEELPSIAQQAKSANPRLRAVIRGDRDAIYGPAEDVMNALQKANVTRFELVTELSAEK